MPITDKLTRRVMESTGLDSYQAKQVLNDFLEEDDVIMKLIIDLKIYLFNNQYFIDETPVERLRRISRIEK